MKESELSDNIAAHQQTSNDNESWVMRLDSCQMSWWTVLVLSYKMKTVIIKTQNKRQ